MTHRNPQEYYDDFSKVYDNPRDGGYHLFLDELETEILKNYVTGKTVLEAGCGTGLILKRVAAMAEKAVGVDLSPGMLEKARERGLECSQADLSALPFPDASFDAVYSFKVLAHVPDIKKAMQEMTRVTKPGGHLILEFYNPYSLRGLVKKLKPATKITGTAHDEQVFTRYDSCSDVLSYAPENISLIKTRGIRVLTPAAFVHDIPLLGSMLRGAERLVSSGPTSALAGFRVYIFRRNE